MAELGLRMPDGSFVPILKSNLVKNTKVLPYQPPLMKTGSLRYLRAIKQPCIWFKFRLYAKKGKEGSLVSKVI
jgi:hypothetical protein